LNVEQLLAQFGLPESPVPLPDPGDGGIFVQRKYDVRITAVAALFLIVVIVFVYLAERKHHRLGTDIVPLSNKFSSAERDQSGSDEL